ncbi:DUF927 domain-containing protein, partial [Paracoccus aestuarii]
MAVIDDCCRENLCLVADTSISGARVACELDALVRVYGKPACIVSDNGTEFTSRAILNPDDSARMRRESLEGRQDQVARPAPGSDPLMFGIYATVAAPLFKLARIETAMFNLHARGPLGKSLALAVATSADRAPAGSARWSLEPALLEQMIWRTQDGILALDFLPENLTGKLLGHLVGLGEYGTYTQHDRDLRGVTLSTSDAPFLALLKRHRKVVPAAMVSRIIDIPVEIAAMV